MTLPASKSLAYLDAESLRRLDRISRSLLVSTGDVALAPGRPRRQIGIVLRGRLALSRTTGYGVVRVQELGPGTLVGEESLLEGEDLAIEGVALEESEIRVIDQEALHEAISGNPAFAAGLHWCFWHSLQQKLLHCNRLLERFFEDASVTPGKPAGAPAALRDVSMPLDRRRRALRSLDLSNMELNYLASLAEPRRADPDAPILQKGERSSDLYLVADGRVMVSMEIGGAGQEALAFLDAGEVFGEIALITGDARSADVTATSEGALVLCFRPEVVSKLLHADRASSPRLLRKLCAILARRYRETVEKLLGWAILSGGSFPSLPGDGADETVD